MGGMDLEYEFGDSAGYRRVFGFGHGDALQQPLGHLLVEEGKGTAFPNFDQHRVEPFALLDA